MDHMDGRTMRSPRGEHLEQSFFGEFIIVSVRLETQGYGSTLAQRDLLRFEAQHRVRLFQGPLASEFTYTTKTQGYVRIRSYRFNQHNHRRRKVINQLIKN